MLSRQEALVREGISYLLPGEEVVYNHRPDWLKNEATGRNLELDLYIPGRKLAIEVNSPFHETVLGKDRDAFKREKCREQGITLHQIAKPDRILRCLENLGKNLGLKFCPPQRYLSSLRHYRPKMKNYSQKLWQAQKRSNYYVAVKTQDAERESNLRRMRAREALNV